MAYTCVRLEKHESIASYITKMKDNAKKQIFVSNAPMLHMEQENNEYVFCSLRFFSDGILVGTWLINTAIMGIGLYGHWPLFGFVSLFLFLFLFFTTPVGQYGLFVAGLRKNGYKGKTKLISSQEAFEVLAKQWDSQKS